MRKKIIILITFISVIIIAIILYFNFCLIFLFFNFNKISRNKEFLINFFLIFL